MLAKQVSCLYWVKSYHRNAFRKNNDFGIFALWRPSRSPYVDQILGHVGEKTLKELSNAAFSSSYGSQVMCQFVEKC